MPYVLMHTLQKTQIIFWYSPDINPVKIFTLPRHKPYTIFNILRNLNHIKSLTFPWYKPHKIFDIHFFCHRYLLCILIIDTCDIVFRHYAIWLWNAFAMFTQYKVFDLYVIYESFMNTGCRRRHQAILKSSNFNILLFLFVVT